MILKVHIMFIIALIYNSFIIKNEIYYTAYLFILMHELAHMIVALVLNIDIAEINLTPFGVNAKYIGNVKRWKDIIISIAGPLMSYICMLLYKENSFEKINALILLFNLLPIYPLDGWRIVKALFGARVSMYCGYIFSALLFAFAIYMLWKFGNIYVLLIVWYLYIVRTMNRRGDY